MRITGKDFGPCLVTVKAGEVVTADRAVGFMRGWRVARVLALAKRWGCRVDVHESEKAQLSEGEPTAA